MLKELKTKKQHINGVDVYFAVGMEINENTVDSIIDQHKEKPESVKVIGNIAYILIDSMAACSFILPTNIID